MTLSADMTTTKIDRRTLMKLRMLAEREKRTQPSQLAIIIDEAFRANPAEQTDQQIFADMMDNIVSATEQGVPSDTAIKNAQAFTAAGRISWGEEAGKVIGVLADGTRCDVDGNVLENEPTSG